MLSPAVATTTLPDPGPLCVGQTAVLTCSVTDGVSITWQYRTNSGASREQVGPVLSPSQADPVTVTLLGIQFTLTLSQSSNPLISQLSFTASPDIDGGEVRCVGFSDAFSSDERTLQVEMICKFNNSSGMLFLHVFVSQTNLISTTSIP